MRFSQDLIEVINYFLGYKTFLLGWISLPVLLIFLDFTYCCRNKTKALLYESVNANSLIPPTQQRKLQWLFWVSIFLFSLFLVSYIFLIFYREDFSDFDNSQLTFYSLSGRQFGMPIWKESGRFWPLGLQEYNFISLFGKSPAAFHSFSVFQLLVLLACCFFALKRVRPVYRLVALTLLLITPGFIHSFFELIYSERNILFWLSIFIVSFQHFLRTGSRFTFFGVLISAQFALYYKEPMFILIGTFAVVRLFYYLHSSVQVHRSRLSIPSCLSFVQAHWIDVSLLSLSGLFVLLYVTSILPYIQEAYSEDKRLSSLLVLQDYLKIDFLLVAMLVVFAAKLVLIVQKRIKLDLFWEPLALGAILYGAAYIKLGMFKTYFMAPVDFITILYIGDFLSRADQIFRTFKFSKPKIGKLFFQTVIVAMIAVILNQSINQSSLLILDRKMFIDSNDQLVSFIQEYGKSQEKSYLQLFFVNSKSNFHIMEFLAFLEYKGFSARPGKTVDDNTVITIKAKNSGYFDNNLCVPYGRPFECFHADQPENGDLIISLPDADNTSAFFRNHKGIRLLFSSKPRFLLPEKILLAISAYEGKDDAWPKAYIAVKI
jgi:hypothetical protein